LRKRVLVAAATAVVLVVGLGAAVWWRFSNSPLPLSPARGCVVNAEGRVTLDVEQMANAATIAAVGIRQGLPEQAVVVALATALQESKLRNLAGGDRDSVGLFQQRPSQGWGTPEQIGDPRYASERFYAALRKVRGWEQMRVTDAAQTVQRSAHPEAYEKWAGESSVLARALSGTTAGAVACTVDNPGQRGAIAADQLAGLLRKDWGTVRTGTPPGVMGLTVSVDEERTGWRYAHWLVAHAADAGVKRVRYGDQEWWAAKGTWQRVEDTGPTTTQRVLAEVFDDA